MPSGFSKVLGVYHIGPISVPAGTEGVKLKAKLRLNMHGLVNIESVSAFEEEEAEDGAAEVRGKKSHQMHGWGTQTCHLKCCFASTNMQHLWL